MSILKTTLQPKKKKKKEALFILLWNNHYNMLLNEKSDAEQYIWYSICTKQSETHISVSTYTDTSTIFLEWCTKTNSLLGGGNNWVAERPLAFSDSF